ncbi:MAG TPA: helix-turn-helix domain-containing protein [Chloroflexota bacterium]|jgi:DNA-binding transcriptional regulator YiaG|nr:helix-turn-helix domain-containing protein [Chloroflexota bacterium]
MALDGQSPEGAPLTRGSARSSGGGGNQGGNRTNSRTGRRARYEIWDAQRVRALRRHMGYTQQQLSEELGTRQQTVSEWETGVYQPRGASAKLLSLVAERAGFRYAEAAEPDAGDDGDGKGEAGR